MGKTQLNDMTTGKPLGILTRFAVPLMLGNTLQFFYTIADSAVVGRLIGVEAFAAVGAAGLYYWLGVSVVLGLTQGFGVLFAQRFGARDEGGLKQAFAAAAVLSLLGGLLFSLLAALSVEPVLKLLNTPLNILEDAKLYLHILLGGLLLSFVYNLFCAVLRALGDSKTPFYAMILSSILNILLDIAFVKFFSLRVAGVALATLIAQITAWAFCFLKICAIPQLRGMARYMSPARDNLETARELIRLGGPMAFRNFVISLGGMALQYVINGFGAVFIAGIAAAWKMYSLLEIVGAAFEGAVAVFVSQNFGAGCFDRIAACLKNARRVLIGASCVIAPLILIFGRRLLGVLMSGESAEQALNIGHNQLAAMALTLPSLFMLFIYRAALQGMGSAFVPMMSGFIELFMRVVCIALLPIFFNEWGVYAADVAGWPIAAIYLYINFRILYKKLSASGADTGGPGRAYSTP
ncbi:MAG: MATE family efflux transporter [Clostridiales bacterium]|jgi:putative MATE family efflux protein|nr:MATE family efflux transporter [Clostridiales bacterium]